MCVVHGQLACSHFHPNMYVVHGQVACSLPARPQEKSLETGRVEWGRALSQGGPRLVTARGSGARECLAVTEGPRGEAAGAGLGTTRRTHSLPRSTGPEVQKQRCWLGAGTQVQAPAAPPLALRDGFGREGRWVGSHHDGLGPGDSQEGPGPLPSPCACSAVSLRAD